MSPRFPRAALASVLAPAHERRLKDASFRTHALLWEGRRIVGLLDERQVVMEDYWHAAIGASYESPHPFLCAPSNPSVHRTCGTTDAELAYLQSNWFRTAKSASSSRFRTWHF